MSNLGAFRQNTLSAQKNKKPVIHAARALVLLVFAEACVFVLDIVDAVLFSWVSPNEGKTYEEIMAEYDHLLKIRETIRDSKTDTGYEYDGISPELFATRCQNMPVYAEYMTKKVNWTISHFLTSRNFNMSNFTLHGIVLIFCKQVFVTTRKGTCLQKVFDVWFGAFVECDEHDVETEYRIFWTPRSERHDTYASAVEMVASKMKLWNNICQQRE